MYALCTNGKKEQYEEREKISTRKNIKEMNEKGNKFQHPFLQGKNGFRRPNFKKGHKSAIVWRKEEKERGVIDMVGNGGGRTRLLTEKQDELCNSQNQKKMTRVQLCCWLKGGTDREYM